METRTRGKGTIDCGLRGSVGTLDDVNPTRLSKRSQGCPLQESPGALLWSPLQWGYNNVHIKEGDK